MYCPLHQRSKQKSAIREVIKQAEIFCKEGHKEVVLTGIHLGNYGKDLTGSDDLVSLLGKLTTATPETSYRISSLEPLEIDERLLSLMQERDNIQPHLHIPLQSGHDEVLGRMNRRYNTEQFRTVINLCHEHLMDVTIGIDILAGFPGETDEQFAAGKTFLQSLDFTYLHVFPYSIRPGTVAAGFKNQIPKKVKKARVAELQELSIEKKKQFYHGQLGNIRPVLVEGIRDGDGMLKGFTDNYVSVRFEGPDNLLNSITPVRLLVLKDNIVIGERVEHHEN